VKSMGAAEVLDYKSESLVGGIVGLLKQRPSTSIGGRRLPRCIQRH
jgi:hypothetical protein